jgi:UDP-N-acetylglucosamine 4-epimerase
MAALRDRKRTWLVTGSAGFIGSQLVEHLLRHGQQVVSLDNFATGHRANLEEVERCRRPAGLAAAPLHRGEHRRSGRLPRSLPRRRHRAAPAALGSVPRSIADPVPTHQTNVTGFVNMLVAAREAKAQRFVYASSARSTATTHAAQGGRHHRRAALALRREQAGERDVRRCLRALLRHAGVGLRYFNVFGARQDPEGAYAAVIPRWIRAILTGEPVEVNGDGETSRDFCYIANVVQANLLAALTDEPRALNEVYNIAVGREHLAQPPARDPAHAARGARPAGAVPAHLPAVPRRRRAPLARRHLARTPSASGYAPDPYARKRAQGGPAVVPEAIRRRASLAALSLAAAAAMTAAADGGAPATIAQVKASIVAVGTFERLRNPQFSFAGTGFVVGDGLLVATNDHVVPKTLNNERGEAIAVAIPAADRTVQIRAARRVASDAGSDLVLLGIDGKPLPALALGDAQAVAKASGISSRDFRSARCSASSR